MHSSGFTRSPHDSSLKRRCFIGLHVLQFTVRFSVRLPVRSLSLDSFPARRTQADAASYRIERGFSPYLGHGSQLQPSRSVTPSTEPLKQGPRSVNLRPRPLNSSYFFPDSRAAWRPPWGTSRPLCYAPEEMHHPSSPLTVTAHGDT